MIEFSHAGNREDGKQAGWVALIDDQGDEMWRGWVSPVSFDLWGAMQDASGRALLDQAAELLRDFADGDECHLDHHGNCQAHGVIRDTCRNVRIKDLLDQLPPDSGSYPSSTAEEATR